MSKLLCLLAIAVVGLLAVRADRESRISGGQNAVNGQFPHHVQIRGVNSSRPLCGGSIVGDRFVITVTICFHGPNKEPSNVRVIVGEVELEANATEYQVDRLIKHDSNDIVVVRVAQPFIFTANVRAIQLPTENIEDGEVPAMFVGWGQDKSGDDDDEENFPRTLRWMNTTAISQAECRRMLGSYDYILGDHHICATDAPGTGVCRFDAGGGLITQGDQPVIIGFLSLRWSGCPSPKTNVYVRVYSHLQFIRTAMQQVDD